MEDQETLFAAPYLLGSVQNPSTEKSQCPVEAAAPADLCAAVVTDSRLSTINLVCLENV